MNNTTSSRSSILDLGILGCIIAIIGLLLFIGTPIVNAAQVTSRKITLGSSAASASTTHKFDFTTATTANIGSMKFQYCTTASGTCNAPTGLDVDGVSISAQSGGTGFSIDGTNTDANNIVITRSASSLAASTAVSYTFSSATNPSTSNTSFYVRITTYTSTNATTGATDTGTVATSTANQITLTGTMDESIVFCTGTSITGTNCGTVSGSSVNFGTFSTTSASTGTSVMAASTNGDSGYAITVSGTTMTSGANTIAALSSQTASSVGTAQFGLNLRDNATPNVGADVSGSGTATYSANYGTADQFRFVSGDTVASVSDPTDANTFTASYIVNVPGSQAAGTYTTTLTYICTATF